MSKTDFDDKLISFDRKITSNKTTYLEVQKRLDSLITKVYNFFISRIYFTSNDGSQNKCVYQPTLDTLELKKDKGIDYVLSWKSKGVFNSKLKSLYTALLNSIKLSRYKMGIKFNTDPLAVEQNNYLTKIVNVYIVYYLDAWSKIPLRNFTMKILLFVATSIVKNSNKEKCVYSGYEIAFDVNGERSFDNDFARNVVTFGVDNSSPFHTDNFKINFLVLGQGGTFGINGSFGVPEKS